MHLAWRGLWIMLDLWKVETRLRGTVEPAPGLFEGSCLAGPIRDH